jgi:hypothetical protein
VRATLAVIAAAEADSAPAGHGFRRRAMALTALAEALGGLWDAPYPHRFAAPPNTGRPTGVDLDGDGRSWRARDAHGYGLFSGDGGMAILSRVPIGAVRDFSDLPWVALPESAAGAVTPRGARGAPPAQRRGLGRGASDTLRPDPHPRQPRLAPGLRRARGSQRPAQRATSCAFWSLYLDGWSPDAPALRRRPFAVMGTLNVDPPDRGEGRRDGLRAAHHRPPVKTPNRNARRRARHGRLVR